MWRICNFTAFAGIIMPLVILWLFVVIVAICWNWSWSWFELWSDGFHVCVCVVVCLRARERERECVCELFLTHKQHQNECESLNGYTLLVLDEMNTNVTKNFFMNDIDGEFYEIEQYTLTMHKICTMWAEYNLAKWKCLSPHVLTLCVDRFSNAVHWFRLGRRHRCCCCCLPFSDVRVNLAWESKQCVTEFIYSVHRPIDTKNDINYGWKRIKTSFVEFPTFFSLFYSF